MKLFPFDKFWELSWEKINGYIFKAHFGKYVITANKAKASSPEFCIYSEVIDSAHSLIIGLDTDMLILQLKSLKETGKIAVR